MIESNIVGPITMPDAPRLSDHKGGLILRKIILYKPNLATSVLIVVVFYKILD